MIDEEYINKLEELSFKFRDDADLCSCYNKCDECKLNTKIKIANSDNDSEESYCDILISIYNVSK